jgi:hypothetical protein
MLPDILLIYIVLAPGVAALTEDAWVPWRGGEEDVASGRYDSDGVGGA